MPVRKPITIAAGIALFVAALGVGYLAGRLAADDGEAPPVGAVGTPTPVAPPADPTPGVTPRPPQLPIIPEVGGFDPVTGLPMDPDRTVPFWSFPYGEAERMLRPYEGAVAGVFITPRDDSRPRLRECPSGKFSWPDDLAAIEGSPIALPARAAMDGVGEAWHVQIVFCDGQPLAANASYTLATDIQKGRYGAYFIVSRFHPADEKRPVVVLTMPAQRLEVRQVAGAPAAVFTPPLPHIGVVSDGAVVTYRDGVVTVVQGDSSLADLIAFTEVILQ
jgi:hypothetical protein